MNALLARAIGQDSDFVAGENRVWHKKALLAAITSAVAASELGQCDIFQLASSLGVFPSDIQPDQGLIVLNGRVCLKERLDSSLYEHARRQVESQGYVDSGSIAAKFGIDVQYVESSVNSTLSSRGDAVPFVSLHTFRENLEKQKLVEDMLNAEVETVKIPSYLTAWAAEVCKSDSALKQHGQLIKGEFEPFSLFAIRQKQVELVLNSSSTSGDGFCSEADLRFVPQQKQQEELVKLATGYCHMNRLEAIKSYLEAEILDVGCAIIEDEQLGCFKNPKDYGHGGQADLRAKCKDFAPF